LNDSEYKSQTVFLCEQATKVICCKCATVSHGQTASAWH